jgi:hypothetical protein
VNGFAPNVMLAAAVTTAFGFVMVRAGVAMGMLRARVPRKRCSSCGRVQTPHGCEHCGY